MPARQETPANECSRNHGRHCRRLWRDPWRCGEVVELAEKYGPEIYTTIIAAIEQSKSGTGPTDADIQAIIAKCVADNAAIQNA